jgi:hypothetical protein
MFIRTNSARRRSGRPISLKIQRDTTRCGVNNRCHTLAAGTWTKAVKEKGFERITRYLLEVLCRYLNREIERKTRMAKESITCLVTQQTEQICCNCLVMTLCSAEVVYSTLPRTWLTPNLRHTDCTPVPRPRESGDSRFKAIVSRLGRHYSIRDYRRNSLTKLNTSNRAQGKRAGFVLHLTTLNISKTIQDLWQSMAHWWNDPDRGKPKYWERNLSRCHFIHHKWHMHRSDIEPGSPECEADV